MANTGKRAGEGARPAGRDRPRGRKPGGRKARVAARKPKSADQTAGKPKPSLAVEAARLNEQLKIARMQQQASAEVLRAVANASGDAARPLQLIAETTARLFAASAVTIRIAGPGDEWRHSINVGEGAKRIAAAVSAVQLKISGHNMPGAVYRENRQIHLPDIENVDPKIADWPGLKPARAAGTRTLVGIPLRREGKAIGALIVHRARVAAFADHELALLQSFADQAVIAIENARLFDAVQAKTRDVETSLQQQAATNEVLRIVASSPDDLQRVFAAMLEKAISFCGAKFGGLFLYDGKNFTAVADQNLPLAYAKVVRGRSFLPEENTGFRHLVERKKLLHVTDLFDASYARGETLRKAAVELGGVRSLVAVPLLKKGELIGNFSIYKEEAGGFADNQIALVTTFADQAVIAIANARLFNETKEALERQTATAEILKVIASSPSDVQPVFEAIATSANRLLGGFSSTVFRFIDGIAHLKAFTRTTPEADEILRSSFPRPVGDMQAFQMARAGEVMQIPDTEAPSYELRDVARARGYRSMLFVPLMNKGESIGLIAVTRVQPGTFVDHHVQLLKTFADQAVIAIENARLFDEVQAKTHDLEEALQQQTATSDVLKVISRSAFDLQTVLETLTESAARLCGADMAAMTRQSADGGYYHATRHNFSPEWTKVSESIRLYAEGGSLVGRVLLQGKAVQIADVLADPKYTYHEQQRAGGYRTLLGVPLLRSGQPIGVFFLGRKIVEPFTEKQIELVSTFADQAVIAIENTRLFNETKEALEQQKATSDILAAINSSGGFLAPVFECILEKAHQLCGAPCGSLQLYQDGQVVPVAIRGMTPAFSEFLRRGYSITEGIRDGLFADHPVQRIDMVETLREQPDEPSLRAAVELGGVRTMVWVPLLRDGVVFGRIIAARQEVRPFDDKQIATLQGFAAQAVIAIENARLLQELRARTDDLTESLHQQTATADVLKVISRSAFDVKTVLDTLVESATRLCDADSSHIYLVDGDVSRLAACSGFSKEYEDLLRRIPLTAGRGTLVGRTLLERGVVHLPDAAADEEYKFHEALKLGRFRTMLGVPMLRDGSAAGVLSVTRSEVRPFTDRQIALLQTFADQAVIAIENARLFNEVQAKTRDLEETLQQQTATADVLKVISRSPDKLKPVLDVIVETSRELCNALTAVIFLLRDGKLHDVAESSTKPEYIEAIRFNPISPDQKGSVLARAVREKRTVHVPNSAEDPEAGLGGPLDASGPRSLLSVPLILDGRVIGGITLQHERLAPFTARQIEAVETFADQAVIAISNVNLFEQVQQRTRELAQSLDDLRNAQDRLIQTEKLASLGQLTAGIAHEIKNPLNFVNNFSALSNELIDELSDVLKSTAVDGKARQEVGEITKMLKDNLEKVIQHGKRADSIVKNMLLHSREGSGERRSADINAIVEESLNLAYHGARAERSGFNMTLKRDLDPAAGMVDLYPQEITRVLLNLISNGFYAASKRHEMGENGFEPTLAATTKDLGKRVEIRIRDNGTGIPASVREKMFNPFFTTKPAGEGTGLGLSMSHDIVVKQHGGTIDVETEPGAFTEFIITLPRELETPKKSGGVN